MFNHNFVCIMLICNFRIDTRFMFLPVTVRYTHDNSIVTNWYSKKCQYVWCIVVVTFLGNRRLAYVLRTDNLFPILSQPLFFGASLAIRLLWKIVEFVMVVSPINICFEFPKSKFLTCICNFEIHTNIWYDIQKFTILVQIVSWL